MKIIIKKLEITSFGCLKNKVFTPEEGINKIIAPNESGKSTLAAAIKFIFYGFGSSKKEISDSDKKMYLPWDTSTAICACELTADGILYRVERKYAPSQKENLSITEVSSGKAVYVGLCPGEVFFGANMETAEKTFIFDQYCALTARDGELFDSIRNMVFQGDESGGSETAIKRLKEAKKELKNSRGGGLIPTLEKEFEKYKSEYDVSMGKIQSIKDISTQISLLEKNVERNAQSEKKLLKEKENVEKYKAYLKLQELRELEKEAQNAEVAYKISAQSLEGAGIPDTSLLEDLVSANGEKLSLSSLKEELKLTLDKCEKDMVSLKEKQINSEETTEQIKSRVNGHSISSIASYFIFVILGITGIYLLATSPDIAIYPFIVGGICLIAGLLYTFKKKKYINSFNVKNEPELLALLNAREETEAKIKEKSNEIETLKERIASLEAQLKTVEEKLSSVLGRYFKNPTEDTAELIRRLRDITEKVAQAKKIAESKKESLLKTTQLLDRAALEEKSIGAVAPERSEEEIEKQLRFVQNGKKLMEDKIISAEKEKAVMESSVAPPSMLFEKAEATYNKLQWAKRRFDAINTALELIENASDELKRTLAPKITAYASELFNIATDGKYKALNVTTELSLTTDNGETVKSAEYLSAGGRATAYVCLRLALLKVIYNDTFPPIIFDDAFVRLDKNRLEQIKKAIMSSPAKDAQIFIFSALYI